MGAPWGGGDLEPGQAKMGNPEVPQPKLSQPKVAQPIGDQPKVGQPKTVSPPHGATARRCHWGVPVGRCPHGCAPALPPRQDVGLLELFSRGEGATPYTFYKTFGGSTHTFEAAACPGAFLSTAGGQELGLAPPSGATSFYLHRK